jgi:hypothetical protein
LPDAAVLAPFEPRSLILAPEMAALVCGMRHVESPQIAGIFGSIVVSSKPNEGKKKRQKDQGSEASRESVIGVRMKQELLHRARRARAENASGFDL